jgi:predicted porin
LLSIGVASAEVTITGFVDQAVQSTTTTSSAGKKATKNTIGSNLIGQDQITFGITEDLGDGMSAYVNMVFVNNVSNNGGSLQTDTGSGVGLRGAFGSVFLGNVYSQVWQTMAAADASGWGAGSKGSVWANTNGIGANSRSLVYTLPTFVQGLDASVEQSYANTADSVGDMFGIGISYTTGGLSVKFAANQLKTKSGTTTFSITDGAGTDATGTAAGGTFDGSTAAFQALALTYDLGVAKLFFGSSQMSMNDDGDAAESKSTYGINVPLGAVTLGFGLSTADFTNSGSVKTSLTGDKLFAKYALSKRTNVYVTTGKASTSGSSAALTNSSLGITHSF